mmetsp:Transcript_12847/g.37018  ORF Transcript_12847/g.37018 Transcript_12847/m.37018 type:complete len:340 (+) Transcript_12847:1169-2188(+)
MKDDGSQRVFHKAEHVRLLRQAHRSERGARGACCVVIVAVEGAAGAAMHAEVVHEEREDAVHRRVEARSQPWRLVPIAVAAGLDGPVAQGDPSPAGHVLRRIGTALQLHRVEDEPRVRHEVRVQRKGVPPCRARELDVRAREPLVLVHPLHCEEDAEPTFPKIIPQLRTSDDLPGDLGVVQHVEQVHGALDDLVVLEDVRLVIEDRRHSPLGERRPQQVPEASEQVPDEVVVPNELQSHILPREDLAGKVPQLVRVLVARPREHQLAVQAREDLSEAMLELKVQHQVHQEVRFELAHRRLHHVRVPQKHLHRALGPGGRDIQTDPADDLPQPVVEAAEA